MKSPALSWVTLLNLAGRSHMTVGWLGVSGSGSAPRVPHPPWSHRLVEACSFHGDGRGTSRQTQPFNPLARLLSLPLTRQWAKQVIWPSQSQELGASVPAPLPYFLPPPTSSPLHLPLPLLLCLLPLLSVSSLRGKKTLFS